MKTIKLKQITYFLFNCTAIAACDEGDENKRQNALLVISSDGTETTEKVVFGWSSLPQSEEEFNDMAEDSSAWETAEDTVLCPELGDGISPWKNYVWGEQ